jgi:YegS/Rv2252/BmrU family lipid kinase
MSDSFFVVINPNAGKRRAEKDWQLISSMLLDAGIKFNHKFTTHKFHANTITVQAIEQGFRKIIAIGGDGTFNEVINAIFYQKSYLASEITIGVICVGTGNDWCRTLGIPDDYSSAINIIKSGNTKLFDVGLAHFNNNGTKSSRYFANVAGMGFDAMVAKKVNEDKDSNRTGKILYLKNLLLCLLKSKTINCSIKIDALTVEAPIFSMSVGIGRYNGGGMMQLPNAIPDDGLLDITLIKKISRFDVIMQTKNLYDGTFIKHPSVALYRGKKVEIDTVLNSTADLESAPTLLDLELDGEYVGHSPVEFEILPSVLNVFIS